MNQPRPLFDGLKNGIAIQLRHRQYVGLLGSGRSVAWLARLFRVQEVVSSNLTAPTILLQQVRWKLAISPLQHFAKVSNFFDTGF